MPLRGEMAPRCTIRPRAEGRVRSAQSVSFCKIELKGMATGPAVPVGPSAQGLPRDQAESPSVLARDQVDHDVAGQPSEPHGSGE